MEAVAEVVDLVVGGVADGVAAGIAAAVAVEMVPAADVAHQGLEYRAGAVKEEKGSFVVCV